MLEEFEKELVNSNHPLTLPNYNICNGAIFEFTKNYTLYTVVVKSVSVDVNYGKVGYTWVTYSNLEDAPSMTTTLQIFVNQLIEVKAVQIS